MKGKLGYKKGALGPPAQQGGVRQKPRKKERDFPGTGLSQVI
jgi:hypothetical protein